MRKNNISSVLCAALYVGAILVPNGISFAETIVSPVPVNFRIPQHTVADALILFAEQSGEQIIFHYDEAGNIPAQKLSGQYLPIEALAEILRETGLKAYRNPEGTIVIRKDPDFEPAKSIPKPLDPLNGQEEENNATRISVSEPENPEPEELIITGSRIKRAELSAQTLGSGPINLRDSHL